MNSQIINRLMDAELAIADMSMHNASAFYELAIRHMVRLPTIKASPLRQICHFDAARAPIADFAHRHDWT
jgi:hypothetical protein